MKKNVFLFFDQNIFSFISYFVSVKQINDLFEIDVNNPPTASELKKQFYKLVRLHHPDKNIEDQQAATIITQLINSSYDVIKKRFNLN